MALNLKQRKFCTLKPQPSLPVLKEKAVAHFNQFNVIVKGEIMKSLVSMGYFGKANLSRNYPQFPNSIIRKRQYEYRRKFNCEKGEKVIIISDSDSDDDCSKIRLQPKYEIDKSGLKENVHLMLEEAYFLAFAINCLNIEFNGEFLTAQQAWDMFQETDEFFIENYVVYYHLRAKNWVVKSGLKFGGEYLLYQKGPPFYHASYVVIIEGKDKKRRDLSVINVMGLHRLCETSGKELLICQVISPENPTLDLTQFTVKELLIERWLSTQERN